MRFFIQFTALFSVLLGFTSLAPAYAGEQAKSRKAEEKERIQAQTAGKIAGIIANSKDPNNPKDVRIYGLKKLYENKDVEIYRGFDKNGRRYTFTKRK